MSGELDHLDIANIHGAFFEAGKGTLYSREAEVFSQSEPQVFARCLRYVQRNHINGHHRPVLSGIGLANAHTQSRSNSDVFGSRKSLQLRENPAENGGKTGILGELGGEDAHAVPDSETCAPAYGPFLQYIMGCQVEGLPLGVLQEACLRIGGTDVGRHSRINEEGLTKRFIEKILKYVANDAKHCVKNLAINKTRVKGPHETYYSTHPSFLVVPAFVGTSGLNAEEEGRIAGIATDQDLINTRELLSTMVKALADCVTGQQDGHLVRPIDLIKTEEQKTEMQELLSKLESGKVDVPGPAFSGCRVFRVDLQNNLDYEIPDPLLLAMKAAINWYYMKTGLKLLPVCAPPEDPEKALIRQMNEELNEQVQQEQLHAQTWEDLGRGFGQYYPSTSPTKNTPALVSLSPEETITPPKETQ